MGVYVQVACTRYCYFALALAAAALALAAAALALAAAALALAAATLTAAALASAALASALAAAYSASALAASALATTVTTSIAASSLAAAALSAALAAATLTAAALASALASALAAAYSASALAASPIAPLRACLADPFKEMLETNSQKSQRISPCQSVSQSVSSRPPRAHSTTVSPDGSAPSVNTSISLFVRLCSRLACTPQAYTTDLFSDALLLRGPDPCNVVFVIRRLCETTKNS